MTSLIPIPRTAERPPPTAAELREFGSELYERLGEFSALMHEHPELIAEADQLPGRRGRRPDAHRPQRGDGRRSANPADGARVRSAPDRLHGDVHCGVARGRGEVLTRSLAAARGRQADARDLVHALRGLSPRGVRRGGESPLARRRPLRVVRERDQCLHAALALDGSMHGGHGAV